MMLVKSRYCADTSLVMLLSGGEDDICGQGISPRFDED
jgi:hypothetical protein